MSNGMTATKVWMDEFGSFDSHMLDALKYQTEPVQRQLELMKRAQARLASVTLNPPLVFKPGDIIPIGIDSKYTSKEKQVTTKKAKPEKFNTIGVRFLGGQNPEKIYTYKVRIGAKPYLGQELIADTARGPAAVVVVRTDKTPNQWETYPIEGLKYITKKAVAL